MRPRKIIALTALLSLSGAFYGCATTASNPPASNETGGNAEKKTSSEDSGKALKKRFGGKTDDAIAFANLVATWRCTSECSSYVSAAPSKRLAIVS